MDKLKWGFRIFFFIKKLYFQFVFSDFWFENFRMYDIDFHIEMRIVIGRHSSNCISDNLT